MKIRPLDFETTGFKGDKEDSTPAGIMEVGYCDMRYDSDSDNEISAPIGRLVDCGIPCSIEARAVHHISDEMCAGEIKPQEACALLMEGDHEYFASHNVDMEKSFFGGGDRKWLCTYKIGLRLWPDAPGHKLNELRYFLDIDDNADFDLAHVQRPHRAPDDAYICAHVLRRELQEAAIQNIDIERMVSWSKGPALLYMCFMKKYKGTPWHQVPADYLRWILEKSDVTDRDIRATAKFYLRKHEGTKS